MSLITLTIDGREGGNAAAAPDRFLRSEKILRREKAFSSIRGRLEEGEVELFLKGPSPSPRVCAGCGPADCKK